MGLPRKNSKTFQNFSTVPSQKEKKPISSLQNVEKRPIFNFPFYFVIPFKSPLFLFCK